MKETQVMEHNVSREQFEELLSTELASMGRTTKNATNEEFYHAIVDYQHRERRFGKTSEQVN